MAAATHGAISDSLNHQGAAEAEIAQSLLEKPG